MTIAEYIEGIQKKDIAILAKAITLIESSLDTDKKKAQQLIDKCIPIRKESIRIGVSGTPGVGKSTFIESLGMHLTKMKKKVAVLTIDPSSSISKGSILGDKTRMKKLSNSKLAFIRPSPSGGSLGGVCNSTQDSITLCEAAGYNIILIETVGVGQSETMVDLMTDFFIYLTLTENGDEVQFIKKGVLELSDIIIINKSDLNKRRAKETLLNLRSQIEINNRRKKQNVFICSALHNENIKNIWKHIEEKQKGEYNQQLIKKKRKQQNVKWVGKILKEEIVEALEKNSEIKRELEEINDKNIKNPRKKALAIMKKIKVYFEQSHR